MNVSSLVVGLVPRQRCTFRLHPARPLHAALLRLVEAADPALSAELHEATPGAHDVVRPWTLSGLAGPLASTATGLIAEAGQRYWMRLTTLTDRVHDRLTGLLDDAVARGRTLDLERVPFALVPAAEGIRREWQRRTSDRELLARAAPVSEIHLAFLSPTAFRRGQGYTTLPEPALCLSSYLRRWNRFADPAERLDEAAILAYGRARMRTVEARLAPRAIWLGDFGAPGQVGELTWQGDPADPIWRQVNALVDYAFFCGTGIKTAMGMGQTRRASRGP